MKLKKLKNDLGGWKNRMLEKPTPQRLAELKQQGYTQKDIATIYGRSERMVRYWKKDDGEFKQKRGRRGKIVENKPLMTLFYCLFAKDKSSTQQEIADEIFQNTGQKISRFSVLRMLKKLNITRKKLTYHYVDQLKHKERIEEFKEIVPYLPQSRTFALDECSFHLNEAPRYGYSHKNLRANSQRPGSKGKNHTLILCIQNTVNNGVVHWELIEGGMKTKNFHDFLTNLKLPTNVENHLLMDNLSVHKAKDSCIKLGLAPIKELMASKNIKPNYLPPYTPEMNPVELCFNFIRQQVEKSKPRTYEELKFTIAKINMILNQKDLTQYFQRCSSYDSAKNLRQRIVNKENAPLEVWRILNEKRVGGSITCD